jgi:hypothetical protein
MASRKLSKSPKRRYRRKSATRKVKKTIRRKSRKTIRRKSKSRKVRKTVRRTRYRIKKSGCAQHLKKNCGSVDSNCQWTKSGCRKRRGAKNANIYFGPVRPLM